MVAISNEKKIRTTKNYKIFNLKQYSKNFLNNKIL
jgi:hypothetical protein